MNVRSSISEWSRKWVRIMNVRSSISEWSRKWVRINTEKSPGVSTLDWSSLLEQVMVRRVHRTLVGVEIGRTVSYFVSNAAVLTQTQAETLYAAIGGHWQIETRHYYRDVVLAEDDYRSKFMGVQRVSSWIKNTDLEFITLTTAQEHEGATSGFCR